MTPKEKAEELVNEMMDMMYIKAKPISYKHILNSVVKRCALVAVDQIITAIDWHEYETPNDQLNFWEEVKQEINNL